MEVLSLIITFIAGSFTVPIVNWLKTNVIRDVPIETLALVTVLNVLIAWGVGEALGLPDWSIASAIQYILSAQFGSQVTHALGKTIKEKRD